jgi:hypothetical protein
MKSLLVVTAMLLAANPALAEEVPGRPSTDSNPDVRVEGNTLLYIGRTNDNGLQALCAAVHDNPRETVVRANSRKALASVAIDTGLFIDFAQADNQWQAPQ